MLDSWAQSAVPRSGEIEVTLDTGQVVQIVMTPDDLDNMYVAFGPLPHIFEFVTERLEAMPEDCDYLVYTQYDLEPFPTRRPPPEPEMPEFTGGQWFAHGPRSGTETVYDSSAGDDDT